MAAKVFVLERQQDISGVSGTGVVADGVEFWDEESGLTVNVVLCWRMTAAGVPGLGVYRNMADVEKIHGHNGATKAVYR